MNWYLVKIIVQLLYNQPAGKTQFEEQLRLICAADTKAAIAKATGMLMNEEERCSSLQQHISCKPIAVTAVYPFSEMMDGAELFSANIETDYAASFIKTARVREQDILASIDLFTN